MKKLLTPAMILVGILYWMHADAQVSQAWVQQYVESDASAPFSVDIKTDGSFVYVLGTKCTSTAAPDVLLLKYSSAGTLIWEHTYDGPNHHKDVPTDLELDAAGNLYVVGTTDISQPEYTSETFTLKYNNDGTLLWSSRYLRPDNNRSNLTALAVDAAGNVYVTGHTEGDLSYYDFLTIKYNSNGVQQWLRTFNGTGNGFDGYTHIAVDATGNAYVTGQSDGTTYIGGFPFNTKADYRTIKYDPNGTMLWSKRAGTINQDMPTSLVLDGASNVYITGQSNGPSETDYLTLKYDLNGALLWSNTYNGPEDGIDEGHGIAVNSAGESYVTGFSGGRFRTIKYSAAGGLQWISSYGPPANGHASPGAITLDGTGNVYVLGYQFGANGLEFATVKYNSSGVQSWAMVYGATAASYESPTAIAVYTPPGPTILRPTVYVTGSSVSIDNNSVRLLVTIRYSQSIFIGPLPPLATANYPNPFSSSTTIVYELTEDSDVSLQIVDILTGRSVETISLGKQNAGEQSYLYQPGNLPKGNYVYTIVAASASGRSVQRSVMRVEE